MVAAGGGRPIHFGKYELISRINIGGMAEIVKARDTSASGRVVAVKRILPHLCEDQQYKTMFLDESRVLAQLHHEDIIHTYEIGEVEGTPYIALEFVDGQDARMLFHRARRDEERIPVPVACFIIAKVCEGLHHAHEQTDAEGALLGLVHRDVSLQNVLLSYDGDVKITDFGIAMSSENVARTEVGIVKGKFGYMSPEQIKGAPLDRRSDVFAAGICLYELLTRERLFSGDSDYKAVERVRNVDIQPPSSWNREIPSNLERIVMKALAKHPRDRYQTANDMRRALLAFMSESGQEAGSAELGALLRRMFKDEIAGTAVRADATPTPMPRDSLASTAPLPAKARVDVALPHDSISPAAPRATPRADATPTPTPRSAPKLAPLPSSPSLPSLRGGTPPAGSVPRASVTTPEPAPALVSEQPKPRAPVDAATGLAAFDDLDKPSALNFMAEPEPPPPAAAPPQRPSSPSNPDLTRASPQRVPSTVPRPESIPGLSPSAFLAAHSPERDLVSGPGVAPVDMDWDEEEPPTQSRGFEGMEHLVDTHEPTDTMDEDVTRQVRVDDTYPGLRGGDDSGAYPPTLGLPPSSAASALAAAAATAPPDTSAAPRRSYLPIVAVVVGLIVVIALALRLFGKEDIATIRFSTEPKDALVTVDGVAVAGSSSPFAIQNLDPDTEHTITVTKPGFSTWSTRLRVHGGQVLDLPPIMLEPQLGAVPTPAPTAGERVEHEQTKPEATRPSPRERTSSADGASARKPAASPERERERKPAPAPTSASSAGKGTLRINSRPWSRVLIDGKLIGNTPQMNIPLAAGSHKVKLVNPEFGLSKTITVNIKPGQTVTHVLTLQ